jgi:hypothetical protein
MTHKLSMFSLVLSSLLAGLALGCEPGGVGDPCTPEDEYTPSFSGFSVEEVNVESKSFQCVTRICLVNHFRGRVSCPYGNQGSAANSNQTPPDCVIPGSPDEKIEVAVDPQLVGRQAEDAVYCSCRCDGPDETARYCECPSGYGCVRLVDDLGIGGGQLAGSYCVREGTEYEKFSAQSDCKYSEAGTGTPQDCGRVDASGEPED